MSIHVKMLAVMSEVDRIEKDRTNTNSNYKYASEKVIKEVLHFALVKHGVLFSVSASNPRVINSLNKDGQQIAVCMALDVAYKFTDPDSGTFLEGTFVGSGNARDDKGIYAALTGAIKYILTSNFLIPTGDDPEDNFFDRYLNEEKAEKGAEIRYEKNSGEVGTGLPDKKKEGVPPEPVRMRVPPKPAVQPPSAANDDILMTEQSRNVVIANFDKLRIEIWDLEKRWGVPEKWTMKTRRDMLQVYNKIVSEQINYSAKDFLEGK